MPLIECTLIKGYDEDTRRVLAERVTDAACSTIGAASDFVTVTINEVESANYMRGRTRRTPASAPQQPDAIIKAFLAAMEQRDLATAQSFLADGFTMVFPGNARFTTLEELIAWARERYQSVSKTFEAFDVSYQGLDAVVHCHGTLAGLWLDGSPFSGIRFIDRFTLSQGRITSQKVWNDLAEMRPS